MNNTKKISLAIVLVIVIGSIWYLESLKAQPGANGGNSATQAINIDANATSSALASAATGTAMQSAGAISLQSIAAADVAAGKKPAIEIAGPTGFINASSSFTLKNLIGKKVVLLDFWTYSCINCIRTLPYLTAWYSKYKDQGLEIVGIHTPEFDFEKDINNVQAAVRQYGIKYPVILDSNMGTWNAYGNLYWPREYLIDIAGYIVHDQVGEGGYDGTEAEIQRLLAERAEALGGNTSSVPGSLVDVQQADLSGIYSPETYFGAERNELLANGNSMTTGAQTLTAPNTTDVQLNHLYLDGKWNFIPQYATNVQGGEKVFYEYDSAKVFLVASAPAGSAGITVEVLQDGHPVADAAGSDVKNGKLTITSSRLYSIISNPGGSGVHTLELIIDSPGGQFFTFTFG